MGGNKVDETKTISYTQTQQNMGNKLSQPCRQLPALNFRVLMIGRWRSEHVGARIAAINSSCANAVTGSKVLLMDRRWMGLATRAHLPPA